VLLEHTSRASPLSRETTPGESQDSHGKRGRSAKLERVHLESINGRLDTLREKLKA
jgi:hypothetical protein